MNNMNISAINPYISNNHSKKQCFQGNNRMIFDPNGKFLYRTTTYFYRDDINWSTLINLIIDKYKDVPKVNVVCHACSDGAEVYTILMELFMKLKNKMQKFIPIIAKDIDEKNIENCRQGYVEASGEEKRIIDVYTNGNAKNFFDIDKNKFRIIITPKNWLKGLVSFEQGNILQDVDKLSPSNTVLFCRNFWPYLSDKERLLLAEKLSRKLDRSSLVVIGGFDVQNGSICNAKKILEANGFKETHVTHVFEKI